MHNYGYFCPQENLPKCAIFLVCIDDKGYPYVLLCPHMNIRLSVPLLSWCVGTPSLFFHIQHLKGGVLQHDTKATDTAERTNCRI